MGGVARQPAAALSKAAGHDLFKFGVGDPKNIVDGGLEPGGAFGQEAAQLIQSVAIIGRFDDNRAVAIVQDNLTAGVGGSDLEAPTAFVVAQRPQDAEVVIIEDQLYFVVQRLNGGNFVNGEELWFAGGKP